MTFIEQAAIAAMQGILSRPVSSVHKPEDVAKMAMEQAHALYEFLFAHEVEFHKAELAKLGVKPG